MSLEHLEQYNRIRERESKIAQLWNEYERLLQDKQEALENNIKILRVTCEKLHDSASQTRSTICKVKQFLNSQN